MKGNLRPAFYALPAGAWRDYVTLLHLPYTAWHLSYVVLGAAAAPTVHPGRTALAVAAFFLAVGLGAHALDEYHGRPLGTHIPDGLLMAVALVSIAGAAGIGLFFSVSVSLWTLPFVIFGGFVVLAYNLEIWGGRFHSDAWFGVAWGAFPALVGYWANAERVDVEALMVAGGCLAMSLAQRTLSKHVRALRRKARGASGRVEFQEGRVESITIPYLLAVPESALRLMGLAVPLLALGWLVARL